MSILSAPTVSEPLFECSQAIEVSGQFTGSEIVIFTNGQRIAGGISRSATASFPIDEGANLIPGMRVYASQTFQGDTSDVDPDKQSVEVLAKPSVINPPNFIWPTYTCAQCTE